MSHIDGTRKSYSSPYEITVCMTKEECKILLPFFQKAYKSVKSKYEKYNDIVSIRPRACFFPLFSFLPLWLHYNLNPLCVQY